MIARRYLEGVSTTHTGDIVEIIKEQFGVAVIEIDDRFYVVERLATGQVRSVMSSDRGSRPSGLWFAPATEQGP